MGAFVAKEEVAEAMKPGDHGTTYGGNPFCCAAVNAVFECFKELNLADNAAMLGAYLKNNLSEALKDKKTLKDIRGLGLMMGVELTVPAAEVIEKARKKGLIVISAGKNIIRLVPPLVYTKGDADKLVSILADCIE